MATKAQSVFLAALTATDQLTDADRKQAKTERRRTNRADLYRAWLLARMAYHTAAAHQVSVSLHRFYEPEREADADGAREVAAAELLSAMRRYAFAPCSSKGEVKDKAKHLREWIGAMAGTKAIRTWNVVAAEVIPHVEAEARSLGLSLTMEAGR